MKIFLSHASEDKAVAESITFSLRNRGHKVFLDRDDLPAGRSYDQQIERAVRDSDAFVFLISPDSVANGRYTLTEVSFARRKWQKPHGRVLPILVRKTPFDQVPSYLKAVTILEPLGNITAETSAAVDDLGGSSRARAVAWRFAAVGAVSGVICSFLPITVFNESIFGFKASTFGLNSLPDVGLFFGLFLAVAAYAFTQVRALRQLVLLPVVVIPIWLLLPYVDSVKMLGLSDNYSFGIDLNDAELRAKLDDKTREMLEKSVKESFAVKAYKTGIEALRFVVIGVVFNVCLLFGLRYAFMLSISRIDLWWSIALGVTAGLMFTAFAGWRIEDSIPLYKASFILMSWPGLIVSFAAWQAFAAASIGHWLGRNVG